MNEKENPILNSTQLNWTERRVEGFYFPLSQSVEQRGKNVHTCEQRDDLCEMWVSSIWWPSPRNGDQEDYKLGIKSEYYTGRYKSKHAFQHDAMQFIPMSGKVFHKLHQIDPKLPIGWMWSFHF